MDEIQETRERLKKICIEKLKQVEEVVGGIPPLYRNAIKYRINHGSGHFGLMFDAFDSIIKNKQGQRPSLDAKSKQALEALTLYSLEYPKVRTASEKKFLESARQAQEAETREALRVLRALKHNKITVPGVFPSAAKPRGKR